MIRADRSIIEYIIRINPMLYGLQDKIEKEQERIVADLITPAKKLIDRLVALDNRRIDLCNLKVLYGFIERELGDKFALFLACLNSGGDSDLFDVAHTGMMRAGYSIARAREEFGYLFSALKPKRKKGSMGVKINRSELCAETF